MPGGQIVLQPPPELQEGEGAGGVLMNAIPMLGSLGSIVLVAGSSTGSPASGAGTAGRPSSCGVAAYPACSTVRSRSATATPGGCWTLALSVA